jgi:DNA repair exonuclease SbcCD nuclease subunit
MADVIAADLHVSELIWASRPNLAGDAYFGLSEIARVVEEYGAENLILAGDLFDTHQPTSADVAAYLTFISRVLCAGSNVFFIEGQHDRSSRRSLGGGKAPPWGRVHPGTQHADGGMLPLMCEVAYLLDWRHPDELPFAMSQIPKEATILVCHQAWGEFLHQQARRDGLLEELIPEHIKTVFTGDHHRRTTLSLRGGNLLVHSPGATHARKKSEPLEHYVLVVEGKDVTPVKIRSRPSRRRNVLTEEDLVLLDSDLTELMIESSDPGLTDEVRQPLMVVRHGPDLGTAVTELCSKSGVHLIAEADVATPDQARSGKTTLNANDLVRLALSAKHPEGDPVRKYAERLLNLEDPRPAIEEMLLGWLS